MMVDKQKQEWNDEEIRTNVSIIDSVLSSFNVMAKVVSAVKGSTVTRYLLALAQGTKISDIMECLDDIKLSLSTTQLRFERFIKNKPLVGIEVPNVEREIVYLSDVVKSEEYKNPNNILPIPVGKDIEGNNVIADLVNLRHLLIAGSTGSGITVFMHNLIASLLSHRKATEVKLIVFDSNYVEYSLFHNVPHLMSPIITDRDKTIEMLQWLVDEMEDRYKLFVSSKVMNIQEYNRQHKEKKMPYLVVVIQDLYDLMRIDEVENMAEGLIVRLAMMARATGIHMVIATKMPTVTAITGMIKVNIPSRISFKVAYSLDSRSILDMTGAEILLGKGDMLYLPLGEARPIRVQGAYISDEDLMEMAWKRNTKILGKTCE